MSKAYKMSVDLIAETCPAIEAITDENIEKINALFLESSELETKIIDIFNDMTESFKDNGTRKMREAFTALCEDYISMEKEKESLESQLSDSKDSADYWEQQAQILQRELEAK